MGGVAGEPLDRSESLKIERDTTRVRKIVATGRKLRASSDIARVLDLLLPLDLPADLSALTDVLDALPTLMEGTVSSTKMKIVIDAFRALEPPLERLHSAGSLQ